MSKDCRQYRALIHTELRWTVREERFVRIGTRAHARRAPGNLVGVPARRASAQANVERGAVLPLRKGGL